MKHGKDTRTCYEDVLTIDFRNGYKFNGLSRNTKTLVDAAARGALIGKTINEAHQLLEEMAANNYQWPSERSSQKKAK